MAAAAARVVTRAPGCYDGSVRSLALRLGLSLCTLASTACPGGGGGSGSGGGSSEGGSSGGSGTTTGTTTGPGDSSTAVADSGSSTTMDQPQGECVLWADECGPDQKCMPWSLEDDQIPDEIRCCAAPDEPDLVGEPCTMQEYNGSCLDSCERGALCVLDDPEGLTGQCRKYCQPGGDDCQPDETCKTFYELLEDVPTVPLCMEQCDPLVQDCSVPNWRCIPDSPTQAGQSGFICVSPPPGDPYGVGEPCALANQCESGLVCVTADRLQNCPFTSCCTAYCSLSEGDGPCMAIDPDLRCIDWMSPDPTWEDVGVCALPE